MKKLSSNNVNNIPIFTPTTLKGVDSVIEDLRAKFATLTWNTKSFGRAFEMKNKREEDEDYIFPAVMTGADKELEDIMALDTTTAYSFMIARGPEEPEEPEVQILSQSRFTRKIHAIFWMNLDSTSETIENRKMDIEAAIKATRFSNNAASVEIDEIFDEPDDIYDGFSRDPAEDQHLYPPYWGVRVVMDAFYFHPCDDTTFASTVLSSLTYSNNRQEIDRAVADGAGSFVDMVPTLDPSGATVLWDAPSLPAGLSLNSSNGQITEGTWEDIPIGLHVFTVTATATGAFTGEATFTVIFVKHRMFRGTEAQIVALNDPDDEIYYLSDDSL